MLQQHFQAWTDEYVAARSRGDKHNGHWGHADIRSTLHEETAGRCAYCESRVAHVAYEHVEHIKPKSAFPELAHAWDNLTAACPVCNTNKGDYYSQHERVINPYEDRPDDHIAFIGGLPYPRDNSRCGYASIKKLHLDRMQLVSERGRRLREILTLLHAWQNAEGDLKQIAAEALAADAEEGEYPTAVRACLETLGFVWPDPATA